MRVSKNSFGILKQKKQYQQVGYLKWTCFVILLLLNSFITFIEVWDLWRTYGFRGLNNSHDILGPVSREWIFHWERILRVFWIEKVLGLNNYTPSILFIVLILPHLLTQRLSKSQRPSSQRIRIAGIVENLSIQNLHAKPKMRCVTIARELVILRSTVAVKIRNQ